MPISAKKLEARIKALHDSYAEKLPAKLEALASNIAALEELWDEDVALETGRLAHNLAGTGETFGFASLGAAARELETHLLAIQSGELPRTKITETREVFSHVMTAAEAAGIAVKPTDH